MKKKIVSLLLLITLLSTFPSALAQSYTSWDDLEWDSAQSIMRSIILIVFGSDIVRNHPNMVSPQGFLQLLIFPFVAMFAVFYGILTEIRIFRRAHSAKVTIAVIMALVGGYGALTILRSFLVVNAWLGTFLFGVALTVGIVLWFYGSVKTQFHDVSATTDDIIKDAQSAKRLVTELAGLVRKAEVTPTKFTKEDEQRAEFLQTKLEEFEKKEKEKLRGGGN